MALKTSPSGESKGRLGGVKYIIAVGSGKGGVGKSTVAVNLAMALKQSGASVAVLDADIYGPSVPIMMGLKDAKPTLISQNTIRPIEKYGIETISMGYMIEETDAVVWRGPMLTKVLNQFIDDVHWGEKDYLVIDLPPGTGDVQLSLSQMVSVTGAVVVTTPQDVSMADVKRAVRMFEMTRVPVMGVVENMAYFTCPDNDKDYYIFGKGRTEEACAEMGVPVMASFPLDMGVGPAADRGEPIAIAEPGGAQAKRFQELAALIRSQVEKDASETSGEQFSEFFSG
jgi:ATP-binding protein involved in chromosome partitioning